MAVVAVGGSCCVTLVRMGIDSGIAPLPATWRDRMFLVLVFVLPVHTVFLSAWISWKPFLILLIAIVAGDVVDGIRLRRWPYHRSATLALLPFLAVIVLGYPVAGLRERYLRLSLAVVVGALLMLATELRLRSGVSSDRLFRTIFRSSAAMGLTGVVLAIVSVGGFGAGAIDAVNDIPGVFRVSKPAYLESGFLALTNWHQDPGYGAAWAVLWSMAALVASLRGLGTRSRFLDGALIGAVWFTVVMAFSRTGWMSLPLALVITTVGLRRERVPVGAVLRRAAAAALTAVLVLGAVWATDRPGVGGDLDLQFAFRVGQGWDLLADLTGFFSTSDEFADRFEPTEERADVWPEYLAMFRSHPVLGVGLGVGWQTNSIRQEPHNLVIELLAETGLAGMVAFLGLLGVVVYRGRGAVAGALLLITFLPSITQTVLFEPAWWFAAGLFLARPEPGGGAGRVPSGEARAGIRDRSRDG